VSRAEVIGRGVSGAREVATTTGDSGPPALPRCAGGGFGEPHGRDAVMLQAVFRDVGRGPRPERPHARAREAFVVEELPGPREDDHWVVLHRSCWPSNSMRLLTQNGYQDSGGQQPAMVVRDACPKCQSTPYKKNRHTHTGKQNHQCQACGRQFVSMTEDRLIADEQRSLVEHLLREPISLRGICRAVGVSLTWLLHFMVECFAACPDHLHVQLPGRPTDVVIRQLEAEADEMWSFVKKKADKQWI
jgi:hypothetical protein